MPIPYVTYNKKTGVDNLGEDQFEEVTEGAVHDHRVVQTLQLDIQSKVAQKAAEARIKAQEEGVEHLKKGFAESYGECKQVTLKLPPDQEGTTILYVIEDDRLRLLAYCTQLGYFLEPQRICAPETLTAIVDGIETAEHRDDLALQMRPNPHTRASDALSITAEIKAVCEEMGIRVETISKEIDGAYDIFLTQQAPKKRQPKPTHLNSPLELFMGATDQFHATMETGLATTESNLARLTDADICYSFSNNLTPPGRNNLGGIISWVCSIANHVLKRFWRSCAILKLDYSV